LNDAWLCFSLKELLVWRGFARPPFARETRNPPEERKVLLSPWLRIGKLVPILSQPVAKVHGYAGLDLLLGHYQAIPLHQAA